MRKFLFLFSLTGESMGRFIQTPSDRAEVVRKLAESAGGTLEAYYWMFGEYDGMAITTMPDSHAAGAVALAVTGTGAFSRFATHELVEASDIIGLTQRAKEIQSDYSAPGSAS